MLGSGLRRPLNIYERTSAIEPEMKQAPLNVGVPEIDLLAGVSRANSGSELSARDTGAHNGDESHQNRSITLKPCDVLTGYLQVHSP
jgi:hypothetical protein